MIETQNLSGSEQAQRRLWREKWLALGRFEAFEFALENLDNPGAIPAEIQDVEERLSDPVLLQGPMRPHTSTRICREAYLASLKEALTIMQVGAAGETITDLDNPPAAKAILYREMWRADGVFKAFADLLRTEPDADQFRPRLRELEAALTDTGWAITSTGTNGSPHMYHEGYLAGLDEARRIIESAA